ncbi:MAG TPA: HAMP domain-containing sensor histidine kinase [Planctomycetota bacterium]|nr:HAMP domain-containing sensor histidine kinase [Planctomycetota bacterium]
MSLRGRMIGGVTGVMLLVWALVTLNLMIGAYARQKANVTDSAQIMGFVVEAWIGDLGDLSDAKHRIELQRRLTNFGLIDGWMVVSRKDGAPSVVLASANAALSTEDERHLNSALVDKRVFVATLGGQRRVYMPVGGANEVYGVRLDLRPDVLPVTPLTSTLWTSVAILFLGTVTLVLLTYVLLNRMVLAPLTSIVDGSRRVSEGDYSRPIPAVARKDEVATMIQAFNSMMEKLDAYHQTLQSDIRKARERITDTERKLFHAQRLSTTGTLAAGIAHEINNPLGGMMNAAEALRSGKLDAAKQSQYLELISDGLNRVKAIVQKILHFRPQAYQPVPVSLRETVERAVSFLDHKASRRGVEIQNDVEADLEPVFGDALELQQAILNILMNAVDASESGKGKIRVSVRREGAHVYISIQDNGMGMSPEELDRCMDPFYTTKDAGEGSGLGLPVAASIVENHGGRLQVRSEKGKGTTVTLELPIGGDATREIHK